MVRKFFLQILNGKSILQQPNPKQLISSEESHCKYHRQGLHNKKDKPTQLGSRMKSINKMSVVHYTGLCIFQKVTESRISFFQIKMHFVYKSLSAL